MKAKILAVLVLVSLLALGIVAAPMAATVEANSGTVIFSEDFEGDWPGSWTVEDLNPSCGLDYWGQNNYRAHEGNYSAYCAEVGEAEESEVATQEYDNYMQAYMYRDVNLSGCLAAALSYYYWLDCEDGWDYLYIGYYDNGWTWVETHTGHDMSWVSESILVPPTATRVGFLFYSDFMIVSGEGAYIDDVVLTCYGARPPASVGGEVYPINKANLLIPWLALSLVFLLFVLGGALVLKRRRIQ